MFLIIGFLLQAAIWAFYALVIAGLLKMGWERLRGTQSEAKDRPDASPADDPLKPRRPPGGR